VLYDHFGSKRELYLHVLDTQNAAMLAEVGARITGTGDGRDRLRGTIAAYLSFAHDRPAARRLLVDPIPSGDHELEQVLRGYRAARTQAVTAMLGPDLAVAGVTVGSTAAAVVEHPEVTLDEVTDVAARMLWSGLPRLGDR
jgi:AcrR family transcriptional regulator